MADGAAAVDKTVALRDELRQWRLALGWWSGLPAAEAFDIWKSRNLPDRIEASTTQTEEADHA